MEMQQLTVLLPTYNRAHFLKDALQGLCDQSYRDFAVVIYDDGSTDDTMELVHRFMPQLPGARYVRGAENRGVAYARNQLLAWVDTPYFAWQDSDDISEPNRFTKQMAAIQGYDVCFSYLSFFNHPNRRRKYLLTIDVARYTSRAGLYNNMAFATGLFSKAMAGHKFNEGLRKQEDVVWLVELIRHGATFTCVPESLYHVRRHPGRLTRSRG